VKVTVDSVVENTGLPASYSFNSDYMNWYLVRIVYQIICGTGDHTPQFDEQLRIVCASGKEEAYFKAKLVGEQEQEVFENNRQQMVRWKFINVTDIYKISELIDGAEVYSRIEEKEHAEAYIRIIHKKAERIFINHSTQQLLGIA